MEPRAFQVGRASQGLACAQGSPHVRSSQCTCGNMKAEDLFDSLTLVGETPTSHWNGQTGVNTDHQGAFLVVP